MAHAATEAELAVEHDEPAGHGMHAAAAFGEMLPAAHATGAAAAFAQLEPAGHALQAVAVACERCPDGQLCGTAAPIEQ